MNLVRGTMGNRAPRREEPGESCVEMSALSDENEGEQGSLKGEPLFVHEPRPWRMEVARGLVGAGSVVRFSRTFTKEDVELFGHITRDYNPVHFEPRFAKEKGFSGLICHGLLVGSMICEPGGQWAWLASGMNFRFIKPVYIGDTITCEMKILDVDERGKALARARFTNQRGELVMEAELKGFLPNPKEREILAEMLSQGDPTNPIGKS